MLDTPLPPINDPEGDTIPSGLPPVADAHVHVFPDPIFQAVWRWFDRHAWPIRYQMKSPEIIDYLLSRGIRHVVALQYAHKPGMARGLNEYMAELVARFPGRLTGMATVLPGEPDAESIVADAFAAGLGGVKLHIHVQCFTMADESLDPIFRLCQDAGKPMVVHAGREPRSPAYACDPYQLCAAETVEAVVRNFPGLRLCVPHMGIDEDEKYRKLVERYDNLWLDTAVALTDFLPVDPPVQLEKFRPDRVMYGSDFPSIAYAWDRELRQIAEMGLPAERLAALLGENARRFFDLPPFS